MVTTYTGSSLYWQPLKPRIRMYAFSDSSYSTPLYSYDPFTDVGNTTKPVSLHFESLTTNAGTFTIEIEDNGNLLDPDVLMRGNRVFIDCSKDGITYQPAFKGLVRSSQQQVYGAGGRNLLLSGYSYLVRLTERIVNLIKQSALVGGNYDRTDSTMFTDNLINDILTTDSNYVYSTDDTALYSIFKTDNITSSAIDDWVPRIDAQLVTVGDAIKSVVDFSNSLVMLDLSNDQLVLHNPDRTMTGTSVFLLTNQMNQIADDADITMYPINDPYKYDISYDYPDSGSRLIASIGNPGCPGSTGTDPGFAYQGYDIAIHNNSNFTWYTQCINTVTHVWIAQKFTATNKIFSNLRIAAGCFGNISGHGDIVTGRIYTTSGSDIYTVGTQIGSNFHLYRDGVPGTVFPNVTTTAFVLAMANGDALSVNLTPSVDYWIALIDSQPVSSSTTNYLYWIADHYTIGSPDYAFYHTGETAYADAAIGTWSTFNYDPNGNFGPTFNTIQKKFRYDLNTTATGPCGGIPTLANAEDVFAVAHDRNMSNRIGVVERVMSSLPTHVRTLQTMNEYLFNKLYVAAKPRFTFDFPSVTMPNKLPKAGDIVTHVDKKANVGLKTAPVQTGIITQVTYDFAQDQDGVLGLRKLGLSTTGIRRGYY